MSCSKKCFWTSTVGPKCGRIQKEIWPWDLRWSRASATEKSVLHLSGGAEGFSQGYSLSSAGTCDVVVWKWISVMTKLLVPLYFGICEIILCFLCLLVQCHLWRLFMLLLMREGERGCYDWFKVYRNLSFAKSHHSLVGLFKSIRIAM